MSGYPPGSGEGSGLDSLLAQLRQNQSKPINLEPSYGYYNTGHNGQHSHPQHSAGYQQPAVSSPVPTPPAYNPQPHRSSAVMSPAETPQPQRIPPAMGGASNADRTSSLLNLLKFSQPSASSPKQPAPIGTPLPPSREASTGFPGLDPAGQAGSPSHNRDSSNLLAALMGTINSKPAQQASPQFAQASQPAQAPFSVSPPSADTQAYLLQLLAQPKPSQSDNSPQLKQAKVLTPPSKASSQGDISELTQALEDATLDMSLMGSAATEGQLETPLGKGNTRNTAPKNPQGLFTYVNPFDQLAASSPRVRTPKNSTSTPAPAASPAIQILKRQVETSDNKRKSDEGSDISTPAHSKRKIAASQASSGPPTPLPDGRTQLEALIGIGASSNKETVSDALSGVGDQVDRQVQEAIARAEQDESQAKIAKDLENMMDAKTEKEFEETAQIAAEHIKKELEKDVNRHALDDLPTPIADAVKDIVDDTAQGHIADSWESADAEDSPVKEEDDQVVKVYNFPMRPWSSITIKASEEVRPFFREDVFTHVAKLKKDFDQIDRTLVTASSNFIVYGMSKNGGIRIIRQDDGTDAKIFTETHDRIFSVSTSVSQPDLKEAIIGTGISGTVYWCLIKDGEGDNIEESKPEMHGFALPPIHSPETETPGGALKTRARKSSGHPEFFAVGRGKSINIIWPSIVMKSYLKNGKDRTADTEKYFKEHSLVVNTSKAGKDYIFSADDTTIVSLDKAGRVKFWDIRPLTKTDIRGNAPTDPIEIKEPLVVLTTTPASEKSWPTSVTLVDKLRPYQRGGPLRYMIVGMKQNHSLQLWDLALSKPVQEIHLPHTKESDAVCSVLYHAATGMIVVGHPTRNSIYFLHLSAPKYTLPKTITQAEYIQKLNDGDPTIPKPDSTAVISGMREYSFDNKGSLRSLDILQTPNSSTSSEEGIMFELYAMHSKGVSYLTIKQADLGWTSDNKVINPVSAEKEDIISIESLKEIPVVPPPEIGDTPPAPTRIVSRPAPKEPASKDVAKKTHHAEGSGSKAEEKVDKKESVANGANNSGAEKPGKNKRRKATSSAEAPAGSSAAQPPKTILMDPMSHARNGSSSKAAISAIPEGVTRSESQGIDDSTLKGIELRITTDLKKAFDDALGSLGNKIVADRHTQTVVNATQQESLLKLVEVVLKENVEESLSRLIAKNINEAVLPAISNVTIKTVQEQLHNRLGSMLTSQLSSTVPKELQKVLPDTIGKALQQPQVLKLMSESLAKSVAFKVEEQFGVLLQNVITPSFSTMAVQTSQRVAGEVQRQAKEQIGALERQRHADSVKIEQLMQLVAGLTETVSSMASAQADFQGQFLRMQQQAAAEKRELTRQSQSQSTSSRSAPVPAPPPVEERLTQEQMIAHQFREVTSAMERHDYQTAVLAWLKTGFVQEFFELYLSQFNPEFMRDVDSISLLSVGSTISAKMEGEHLPQRLAWLAKVLEILPTHLTAGTLVSKVLPFMMILF